MIPWLRTLIVFAFSLAAATGLFALWLGLTGVSAAGLPPLKTGDIVFQTSGNAQSNAIGIATGSFYTHTGLVEIDSGGRASVVEASGPVRTTPLQQWIEHGTGGRITVKRVKGLDQTAARKAINAAHAYDGRPYDPYFYKGRDAIYCSELVYLAFKEGPGLMIGREQRIRDLNIDNAAVRALVEARWRQYPACVAAQAGSFAACYTLMLEQTLVSPASIARDPQLETIYSNFGVAAD